MTELPHPDRAVAIVGLACRVPGAGDAAAFWRLLQAGEESISRFSEAELMAAGVPVEHLERSDYVRAGGVLPDIELFDADSFGMSPAEAALSDPQQRLFMEVCAEALEHSGHDARRFSGSVGLYGGTGASTYFLRHIYPDLDPLDAVAAYRALLANEKDHLCTRVAHRLDLHGPAISVQTACSSSLLAVHLACQALLGGDCDLALAGGVSLRVPQHVGYRYQPGMILSPDGHCRAFDAAAAGTVPSAGAGIVVLRRLADAWAQRDTIHAVLLGSAANNDGGSRAAYAAPSATGQAAVIAEALAVAGVAARTIDYVEAHGTGTALGDAVEIDALNQVFGSVSDRRIALGSVKTNLGHLDTASGVVGLIKAVLCLAAKELVPSLHFTRPNPAISWGQGPWEVCTRTRAWEGSPGRAGVSSFGIGGTNVHVVLESSPTPPAGRPDVPWQLLVVSARSPDLLRGEAHRLADFMEKATDLTLEDVAWTLQVGRRELPWRVAIPCRDRERAPDLLRAARPPDRAAGSGATAARPSSAALSGPEGEAYLADLGARWVEGATVDWTKLHGNLPRRVPLPARAFDRRRHWIEVAEPRKARRSSARPALILPGWTEAPLAGPLLAATMSAWLVLATPEVLPLAQGLVERGARLVRLRWYGAPSSGEHVLDPTRADEWAALLGATGYGDRDWDSLAVLWPAAGGATPGPIDARAVEDELAKVAAFFTALGRAFPARPAKVAVVTCAAQDVGGAEIPDPKMAAILGACRALAAELPHLEIRSVDLSRAASAPDQLARELRAGGAEREVAWRAARRWKPSITAAVSAASRSPLRAGGVYWITGGLGGIGFTLARHLARKYRARLLLTSRTPEREDASRRRAELEQEAPSILVCAADAADPIAMRLARDMALERFGRIDGVVHAAGVAGDRLARRLRREDLRRVLGPKVEGALVLDGLFADRPLDFMALCSSMAAFRGGIGQVAYAGANRFLDAFAHERTARGAFTVSIAWDAWADVGMAAASGVAAHRRAIRPEDGGDLFERALSLRVPSVMATAARKHKLLERVRPKLAAGRGQSQSIKALMKDVPRAPDGDSDRTSWTEAESLVARLWRERLGVPHVNKHDDFFELGGDSLLAFELLDDLRKATGVELPIDALLSRSTVAACGELLESLASRAAADRPRESLLVTLQEGLGSPLFLVHPIGGHVLFYREIGRALGAGIAVVGIRARGSNTGEAALSSVETMAAHYVEAIRSRQPSGPYFLGGASFGGMVAYEMARQLESLGERTALLALLDTPGPGHFPPRLTTEAEVVAYYRAMVNAGPQQARIPEGLVLPMFKAHSDAMRNYVPGPFGGSIVFFRARERDAHNPHHPETAWVGRAAGGMEVVDVAGNHITMNAPPHVTELGRHLRTLIHAAS